ncbi:hypothetical protein [Sphingobacterium sp. UGAL515B_05]|uniref:hypothetical protein n=1 Tax=Sphingobacterium sp. UGAL515B_05 TaxID=2986767 RepID=UPI0029550389|nr:hypothetical protein [Sphingobacterium sp. UGAL515B_05]WON95457.1 hypothetical protein OK025_03365 [Sphingobacterium sp. UGAL515B_05]
MKFSFQSCIILFFASIIGFTACKKLDDEPSNIGRVTQISRLYISFSDYQASNSSLKNMMIVDPADTNNLDNIYQYLSPAKGGGPIIFSPDAKAVFQASATGAATQDTFIRYIPFNNDIYGIPGTSVNIGYTGFTNVKGLGFYTYAQQNGTSGSSTIPFLLAVSDKDTDRSMLYAIANPSGKGSNGGARIIDKQINLGKVVPSSLTLIGSGNEKAVLVGFNNDGTNKGSGFAVYTGLKTELIDRAKDTIVISDNFRPVMKVYIKGKTGLGPVCYAINKKLLAVTAGKEVLFFKNPDEIFSGAGDKEISPDYVVGGTNTGLEEPWGIAIDDRLNEGKFFYVSDLTNKTISRFLLTDQGNASPEITAKKYGTLTPNYIFLDGRSTPQF